MQCILWWYWHELWGDSCNVENPTQQLTLKKYNLIWTTSHRQLIRKPSIAPFCLYLLLIIFVIWLQDTGMKNWTGYMIFMTHLLINALTTWSIATLKRQWNCLKQFYHWKKTGQSNFCGWTIRILSFDASSMQKRGALRGENMICIWERNHSQMRFIVH